ncbi:hypothetical protein [Brachybacterium sp. FME24]|uniref:hypothetical protein n=1 Tax=Brachybacterium sp. FME24 TaxID=2742605 RepID=UPI0018678B87|nr:hypothetical protein [Brachybacterium sp. FME24]
MSTVLITGTSAGVDRAALPHRQARCDGTPVGVGSNTPVTTPPFLGPGVLTFNDLTREASVRRLGFAETLELTQ